MSKTHVSPDAVDPDRVIETVERLTAAGETDGVGGGVPTATLAAELEISQGTAIDHVRELTAAGRLERVYGMGPNGPRRSYLPAGGDG